MSLPKFSEGAISTIQRQSTNGIATSIEKRIDARAVLLLLLQRTTLERRVNSGRKRRQRSETPRLRTMRFCTVVVLFLKSIELQSIQGWQRWIVQRAQPLYWRTPVVTVEATVATTVTRCGWWDLRVHFLVLYNDFSDWTQLLFFVKIVTASCQKEKGQKDVKAPQVGLL